MPREQIDLEGATHKLTLLAEPKEAKQWFGSCGYEHQRDTRWWDGTGVLIMKGTGDKYLFLFQTDRWNDNEKNWRRSLEASVVAFTDKDGYEVLPSGTPDATSIANEVIAKILADISLNPTSTLPSVLIKPLKIEPLVASGVVNGYRR